MSLNLDTRQRAMLEAMHIKLWQPEPVVSAPETPIATKNIASGVRAVGAGGGFGSENVAPQAAPVPTASSAPPPTAPRREAVVAVAPVAAPAPYTTATALSLQPPRLLYSNVDPAQTPAALGAGWLVVAEADHTGAPDPFTGDAGRLLDNMLRAMQLHRHPRVHHMALARSAGGDAAQGQELQTTLGEAVASLQPALVLVMGRLAVQTLLQRREPLGQLRGQVHSLHGVPVVVTFDAPYLLRAQADKARAWADLCLALNVVATGASAPSAAS